MLMPRYSCVGGGRGGVRQAGRPHRTQEGEGPGRQTAGIYSLQQCSGSKYIQLGSRSCFWPSLDSDPGPGLSYKFLKKNLIIISEKNNFLYKKCFFLSIRKIMSPDEILSQLSL